MPIVDTTKLDSREPLPGWHDRYFAAHSMSFAYYDVDAGAAIHGHEHPEEEVWHIIDGTLEITLGDDTHVVGAGSAAIVPSNTRHAIRAITNARVIIASHPVRERVGGHHIR
ncbi:MAG TPA: cupin domain-containing protein [Gemmatimonadaceae bacterium]|nr:cupin domain-containing protein [Gemmatimonadaceae bacterium]